VKVDDGKLKPTHIKMVLDEHSDEHMVKPKLVYISNPTEIGSVYNKQELEELMVVVKRNLILMGGSSALCSKGRCKLSDLQSLLML
jgi:threonine aldolase